jgi:hypothetical protein
MVQKVLQEVVCDLPEEWSSEQEIEDNSFFAHPSSIRNDNVSLGHVGKCKACLAGNGKEFTHVPGGWQYLSNFY